MPAIGLTPPARPASFGAINSGLLQAGASLKTRCSISAATKGCRFEAPVARAALKVPTAAQRAAVTDPSSKAILDAAGLPDAQTIDSTGTGRVPQNASNATKQNEWSARIDRNFRGGRDILTGRYSMYKSQAN